jgi:hypothetical protein
MREDALWPGEDLSLLADERARSAYERAAEGQEGVVDVVADIQGIRS